MTEKLTIEFELQDKAAEGVRRMAEELGESPEELAQAIVCMSGLEWLSNDEFREFWNHDDVPPVVRDQMARRVS